MEKSAIAEHRQTTARSRDVATTGGFLGNLLHLKFVKQSLRSMAPDTSEFPGTPEARLDLSGERWSMLPGSAPPPLQCRAALSTAPSGYGSCRVGSAGGGNGGPVYGSSRPKGVIRRKRPVHVITALNEEDPNFIDFEEEPEDPRVYLPAHRIGDLLPEAATPSVNGPPKRPAAKVPSRKPGASKSMPSLQIGGLQCPGFKKAPLRPADRNSRNQSDSFGLGEPRPMPQRDPSKQREARPMSADFDDGDFPEPPDGGRNDELLGSDMVAAGSDYDDDDQELPD